MQDLGFRVRLFTKPYSVRSLLERLLLLFALLSVMLHGWLLYQLIAVRDIHSALTFLYLFSLLPFSLFMASVWLDHNPGFQRHITLSDAGVRYRLGFIQREHDFDWEEVESITIAGQQVQFELKNGELHAVNLASVHRAHVLQQIKDRMKEVASSREINCQITE